MTSSVLFISAIIIIAVPSPQTAQPRSGGSQERRADLGGSAQGDEGQRVLQALEGGEQRELLLGRPRPGHAGGRHGLLRAASMICGAPATLMLTTYTKFALCIWACLHCRHAGTAEVCCTPCSSAQIQSCGLLDRQQLIAVA